MAKGSTFEQDVLNLFLCGKPISSWAATAGTTKLWAALHTADPSSGDQTTNEVGLTAYTRIQVDRSTGSSGFTVSGSGPASASPNVTISFPQLTSTSTGTATHFSVGHSSAGAGKIYYNGTISPTIALGQNVTPQLTTASSITEL
jgi:hypothetical protein